MRRLVVLLVCLGASHGADLLGGLQIPQKDIVEPIASRKVPVKSLKQLPPRRVHPSSSPTPVPQSVNLDHIKIGNELVHRPFLDFTDNIQAILTGLIFPSSGRITEWEVFAGRDCRISAQVLRPTEVPAELGRNPDPVHAFSVIGENELYIPSYGLHTFKINTEMQIAVEKGDMIGFYSPNPGCISWSEGGSCPVMFRYGPPSRREITGFAGILTVGTGLQRTYSIACTGTFDQNVKIAEQPHVSPDPTASPSETPSSTRQPAPSRSSTPIPSKSRSESNTASISRSSSSSQTPSYTPTPSPNQLVCAQGIEWACSTPAAMEMCHMTAVSCTLSLRALHLPLPEHLNAAPYKILEPY